MYNQENIKIPLRATSNYLFNYLFLKSIVFLKHKLLTKHMPKKKIINENLAKFSFSFSY